MRGLLSRRPSPAMGVALVALFVSLGGVSYGVATGSIDSREIRNNTVRSTDIRNNQVSTRDLRNNSARGRDVRNDTLTGSDVLESSLGEVPNAATANTATTATTANAVAAGSVGGAGLKDVLLRQSTVPLPDNSNASAQVSCNAGERLLGGGANVGAFSDDLNLLSSRPATATGGIPAAGTELVAWRASARNPTGGTGASTLQVWGLCLS